MTAHIVVRSLGEVPATMSRELLHDLLRTELGFDGMVVTDALEMKAISETVGVEEGAIRALAAGADALCLGHDLFDESVALGAACARGGRSFEAPSRRAARLRGVPRSRDRGSVASIGDRRRSRGRPLRRPPGAAGRRRRADRRPACSSWSSSPRSGWLRAGFRSSPASGSARSCPTPSCGRSTRTRFDPGVVRDGQSLVVIARDAHRHEWERAAIDALTARADDAIVIEIGLPGWRPAASATYVATYGAARVNVEAAAEALYSGSRRGVEQSGSSPGS